MLMLPKINRFLRNKDNRGTYCIFLVKFVQTNGSNRSYHKRKEYSKCYKILQLADGSDQEAVRKAFISLCKKYHPDSGTPEANVQKFYEIEAAYRCLQNKFSEERWNVNEGIGEYGLYYKEKEKKDEAEPQVFDIKHTAPQHRQYLSLDGVGSGTPYQRQKQYQKYRASVAIQNVYDHRIEKLSVDNASQEPALVLKDKKEAKKIKVRYGMDRLVEDLIQESMARGDFDNLSGKGKPLPKKDDYNPYVDFVTHKMNQVLIDNGFCPEWITLKKDISNEIDKVKKLLHDGRGKLGKCPLDHQDETKWRENLNKLKSNVQLINKKINQFNLVVPLLKQQMLYFDLEKEAKAVLENGDWRTGPATEEDYTRRDSQESNDTSLFTFISFLFKI